MANKALMGMVSVLRPYWYFEFQYSAVPGYFPIPLMPVNPNRPPFTNPPTADLFAYDISVRNNRPGYSTSLAAMLSVPMIGGDVSVWIPQIPSVGRDANYCYLYVPVWRMRTIRDQNTFKKQGAIYRESYGAPDTTPGTGGDRYVLPAAAASSLVSLQSFDEPAANTLPGVFEVSMMMREGIAMPANTAVITQTPYDPTGGPLDYQQGILDPNGSVVRNFASPMFRSTWMKIVGNELGFWVFKIAAPQPSDTEITYVDWDFGYNAATGYCSELADDCYFSSVFGVGANHAGFTGGYPDSGLLVSAGQAN